VAVADDAASERALGLVSELRRAGHAVDIDTRGGSLKSQMKRADKSGARFAMVLGPDELSTRTAELKPLRGGEPRRVAFEEIASALKDAQPKG